MWNYSHLCFFFIMKGGCKMNDNEVKDRLIEVLDNLDKVIADLAKTTDRMISFCSLMLLVLFGVVVVALVF